MVAPSTRHDRAVTTDVVFTDFRSVFADEAIPQRQLLPYTAWLMASARCASEKLTTPRQAREVWDEVLTRVRRYGVRPEHIAQRLMMMVPRALQHLPASDVADLPEIFASLAADPQGATLDTRMAAFRRCVARALPVVWPEGTEAPDDVVHVTCSGYDAPSPVTRHLAARGWHQTTVTNAWHMGCYGAFPAARIGAGLLLSAAHGLSRPRGRVDILHTEVLSLHADLLDHSPGNLITSTLFADGIIRYALCPSVPTGQRGLKLRAMSEVTLPGSIDEMTWQLSPHGFKMFLSPRVPLLIRDHIRSALDGLAAIVGTTADALIREAVFAVHPGGPRIITLVRDALSLSEAQVKESRAILLARGNMSSATVPHIWQRLIERSDLPAGTPVVSLAFGPGLTASALLHELV